MAAIGPKYLPCSVITDCRCLTSCSGFACASAAPAATPSANATTTAIPLLFIDSSLGVLEEPTPSRPAYSLAEAGRIFSHRSDLTIIHVRGDSAHHAVDIVGAFAFPERGELRHDVLGVLAREPRKLCRDPGAGRAVAAGAGGNSMQRVATAPKLLTERGELLVGGRGGFEGLPGVVRGEALQVGF